MRMRLIAIYSFLFCFSAVGGDELSAQQGGGQVTGGFPEPIVTIVNLKDCLDPDAEAAEQDSCPTGQPSPWDSCPTEDGPCSPQGNGTRCVIPGTHIDFEIWQHYTNAFYFNPPQVGLGETGKPAVEVDRQLCYHYSFCPCRRQQSGAWACVQWALTEDWIIKYERSDEIGCGIAPPNG